MTTRETETTWLVWRDAKTGDIINIYAEETGADGGAMYDSRTTINGSGVRSREQEAGVLRRRILELNARMLAEGKTATPVAPTTDRGPLHGAVSRIEDNVRELLRRVPAVGPNTPHLEVIHAPLSQEARCRLCLCITLPAPSNPPFGIQQRITLLSTWWLLSSAEFKTLVQSFSDQLNLDVVWPTATEDAEPSKPAVTFG